MLANFEFCIPVTHHNFKKMNTIFIFIGMMINFIGVPIA